MPIKTIDPFDESYCMSDHDTAMAVTVTAWNIGRDWTDLNALSGVAAGTVRIKPIL